MRVIVTGSRDWPDRRGVWNALDELQEQQRGRLQVVHGGCPTGADAAAGDWCLFRKVTPRVFRADWERYGKAAGPMRNQNMIDEGADLVLAFVRNDSRGARDTVSRAEKAGIKVITEVINDG